MRYESIILVYNASMSKKKLDQIVVVDVEATCWEGHPPPGEKSDIIEIGVCMLQTATGKRLEKESLLVRPERSRVGPFCAQLTTLTQEQVEKGMPFADACRRLRETYDSRNRVWASYGDYDRKQFESQCRDLNVPYPFGPSHINVKTVLAVLLGMTKEFGMARGLDRLGLPLEGTHHRGADDAWNIAGILSWLMLDIRKRM